MKIVKIVPHIKNTVRFKWKWGEKLKRKMPFQNENLGAIESDRFSIDFDVDLRVKMPFTWIE